MGVTSKRKHQQIKTEKQKAAKKTQQFAKTPFTKEQEKFLLARCSHHRAARTRGMWFAIATEFENEFPGSNKTWNALHCHSKKLKRTTYELSPEDKLVFRRAVDDIRKNRIFDDILIWRFQSKSANHTHLTKQDVKELIKSMDEWDNELEENVEVEHPIDVTPEPPTYFYDGDEGYEQY